MLSFYGMKQSLETPEIMCGKIRAAVERLSDDFAVIARTEALIQGHGQDVAIEETRMYNDEFLMAFLFIVKVKLQTKC